MTFLPGSNCGLVTGPSHDGGYYLIGLNAVHRRLFEEIDWSTGRVLEQTMVRAGEIGLPVHLLPPAYDVDERETLRRLCHHLVGTCDDRGEIAAQATSLFLRDFVPREGRERTWTDKVKATTWQMAHEAGHRTCHFDAAEGWS